MDGGVLIKLALQNYNKWECINGMHDEVGLMM